MMTYGGAPRAALLLVIMVAFVPAGMSPTLAATFQFIGGAGDSDNSWENPANWVQGTLPGSGDTVIVPSGYGAAILDGNSETVQSIQLSGGLGISRGGTLNVTDSITNNGVNHAYFINDGVITVENGGVVGTINNTCTNCSDLDPDNDYFGYIGNTHEITANLVNGGGVVNGDQGATTGVTWTGDVVNNTPGQVINDDASWNGAVTSNTGLVYNEFGATWTGDVKSNDGRIYNTDAGSSWSGDVVGNGADGVIRNRRGAIWTGAVQSNDGSIYNDGGTWNGNVETNSGTVYNTAGSTWNGNMTSGGSLVLAGTVNGFIDNSGYLYVDNELSGVTSLTNTGTFLMEDGQIDARLSAQSWSGTGSATFDFAPGLGRSDYVVLSGAYTAHTTLSLNLVGPSGRALGDIPLIEVGGADTGTLDVSGLPDDGVISYSLVKSGEGWFITTTLNDAPAHAASAAALLARATATATEVPADHADSCSVGRWARALGGAEGGTVSGTRSDLTLGGAQFGYDVACLPAGNGATFGIGVMGGGLAGRFSQDFGAGDRLDGSFGQGFGGIYGDLAAGRLRAMVQGQVGVSIVDMSDPQSAVDRATLSSARYDFSGDATYELAVGRVSLLPEIGMTASNVSSISDNFADVGAMTLTSGATIDTYAGATLKARMAGPGGTAFTPYISLLFHEEPVAPTTALFTDLAGGTATVALAALGGYGALGVGADLLRAPAAAGGMLRGGFKANFKFGPNVAESSYSGYAQMRF